VSIRFIFVQKNSAVSAICVNFSIRTAIPYLLRYI